MGDARNLLIDDLRKSGIPEVAAKERELGVLLCDHTPRSLGEEVLRLRAALQTLHDASCVQVADNGGPAEFWTAIADAREALHPR